MNEYLKKLLILPVLLLLASAPTAQAQMFDVACENVTDNDKAMNYSLYWESFKNEAYVDAMPYLRWVVSCAPLYPSNRDTNFRRLMQAYEHFAKESTDAATKSAYLDSVLVTYDVMVEALQGANIPVNLALAKIEKGRFIQTNAEAMPNRQGEVVTLYREAYQMQPDSTDTYTIQFLFADLLQKGDKAGALAFAKEVKERHANNAELITYVDQYMGQLFANDQERYDFYKARLAANPEDEEALNEVIDLATKMRDTAMMEQLEPQILARLEQNPSVRMYRILAGLRAARGDEAGAIELFQRAIAIATDNTEKRDLYYNIGIYQHRMGQTGAARRSYSQALDLDPNYGRAILGIGDIIAACASGSDEGRTVYWLATDYYNRASNRDPSLASEANQRIGRIRGSFPSSEWKFFNNLSNGQGYTVTACGLNERTTVK